MLAASLSKNSLFVGYHGWKKGRKQTYRLSQYFEVTLYRELGTQPVITTKCFGKTSPGL